MSASLDQVSWPLRTARLTIRPATLDDLEATWAFRRLDDVNRWITRAPRTIELYTETFNDPDALAKVQVVLLEDKVIGDLMFAIESPWAQAEVVEQARGRQAELGWSFDPAYGGQGYATEAVRALIGVAFGTLGLHRVTAQCFADNTASWRMMERLGMRREAHNVRDSLHRDGRWLDGYFYALLAEEWDDAS